MLFHPRRTRLSGGQPLEPPLRYRFIRQSAIAIGRIRPTTVGTVYHRPKTLTRRRVAHPIPIERECLAQRKEVCYTPASSKFSLRKFLAEPPDCIGRRSKGEIFELLGKAGAGRGEGRLTRVILNYRN